ncbi:MAG: potassium transporter TrkG [Gemmiger sp.]|nr:potassium transporter TrkG [Gemmiger sp.]
MIKRIQRLRRITPSQVVLLSFLALILAGAVLLTLPISSSGGNHTPFLDAIFTATSATCVTGLIVHDTATYWSPFGQTVIITLIQVGGMGVVTLALLVNMLRGQKIGLRQRFIMQESIGAPQMAGIVRMTGMIVKFTFLFEGVGALLLSIRFIPQFGLLRGVLYSVFHSISAFCNAGFDLMGQPGSLYPSLTEFAASPIVNLTISALIVVGGIGFATWDDFRQHGLHFRAFRLQTKIVLTTTALLLIVPFLFLLLYEMQLPQWAGLPLGEKILGALFQTVTARTAGFNTLNLGMFSHSSILLMILLMVVGGSPGSTAGGFKTTSLATVYLSVRSTLKRKSGIQVFGRRLDDTALSRATVLIFLYVVFFVAGGIAIAMIDDVPLISALFETSSAIATVGLSLGLTPDLSAPSRLILIFLMYFGRVGGLTMIYAFANPNIPSPARMPQERITIG